MESHVRIIGLLYVFLGASLILIGLAVLLMFGGAALGGDADQRDGVQVVVPLVGAVGGILFVLLSLFSIPALVAGVGLLRHRPWARIITILVSGLLLFVPVLTGLYAFLPLTTIIGLYSLWVMLSKRAEPLFARTGGS